MLGDPEFVAQAVKDQRLAGMVPNLDSGYQNAIANNPAVVMKAFWAQMDSFKEAVGAPMVQQTIPFMRSLTSALSDLGAVANANPKLAANLAVGGAGALGGASLGALGGGIVGGIPGALIGGGIGSIVGALTGLAAVNWPSITAGFDTVKNFVLGIPPTIDNAMNLIGTTFKNAVLTIPDIVSGSISAAFKSIGDMLGNAIKGLVPGGSTGPAQNGSPWNHQLPDGEKHSSLVPPPRHTTVNITANMSLDARRLAQVVTSQMVSSATFPTSAAGADSRGIWMGPSAYPTEQG